VRRVMPLGPLKAKECDNGNAVPGARAWLAKIDRIQSQDRSAIEQDRRSNEDPAFVGSDRVMFRSCQ
jgi:hypothetical protein